MPDYEYQDVLFEVQGAVAYVTLNRPQALNALSNRLRGEMLHAMKVAERDESVTSSCSRLTGALSRPVTTWPAAPGPWSHPTSTR